MLLGFNPTLAITAITEIHKESLILPHAPSYNKEILVKLSPVYLALLALSLPYIRREPWQLYYSVIFHYSNIYSLNSWRDGHTLLAHAPNLPIYSSGQRAYSLDEQE